MANRLRRSGYMPSGGSAPRSVEPPSTGVLVSAVQSGFQNTKQEYASVLDGRMSLAALNGLVLGVVVFYIWTRGIQGGG